MRKMTSDEIRETWFRFFTNHGHKKVESASLIPVNDDSLLWINAGVAPLKKYFDGTVVPDNRRIVNIQKCIRTNDIENVGVTKRHQTFFEMMGNFSIGDYFKDEAIEFAFELLTSEEYFAIPKEKLYVTIYTEDIEARNKWISVGFIEDHIIPLDGNFWEIGEGPCGPDSEIFYDRGAKYDPDGLALEHFRNDDEQERFIEIWNNVFSQFNSKPGIPRSEYKELPSKNIDTGAGLERWACIFQDVDSNFDTDLFTPIISEIESLSGVLYNGDMPFKVIADHIRALTMALSDGASFDNVGRGYVLRRLLRRSVRMGKKLGLEGAFMYKLVDVVVRIMQNFYPDIKEKQEYVKNLILDEENLFAKTLKDGEKKLAELIEENKDTKIISGNDAFKLYDTYGFPFELTLEYLNDVGFTTNKDDFDKCMMEQKNLAKSSRHQEMVMNSQNEDLLNFKDQSNFYYDMDKIKGKVIFMMDEKNKVDKITNYGYVILDNTCFYAESGGQVADTGMLIGDKFKARVLDVKKTPNKQNLHKVKVLDGEIKLGDNVTCNIDENKRYRIEANHSSVHLLQYALRTVISDEIKQAGSKVDETSLRFDFTYSKKLKDSDLIKVENMVNKLIENKIDREVSEMNIDDAKKMGAMALFSEKYGDIVRVVKFDKSIELCGGCHTKNTKNIENFAIKSVESKGSNVYRIVAATGKNIQDLLEDAIIKYEEEKMKLVSKAKSILEKARQENIKLDFKFSINNDEAKSYKDILNEKENIEKLQLDIKNLEKEFKSLQEEKNVNNIDKYLENVKEKDDYKYLIYKTDDMDNNMLKLVVDAINNKLGSSIIYFINVRENTSNVIVKSTTSINACDILRQSLLGCGNGGGSETFAQGALKDNSKIDEVIKRVNDFIG